MLAIVQVISTQLIASKAVEADNRGILSTNVSVPEQIQSGKDALLLPNIVKQKTDENPSEKTPVDLVDNSNSQKNPMSPYMQEVFNMLTTEEATVQVFINFFKWKKLQVLRLMGDYRF